MIKSYLALDRKIALEFHKYAEQTKEYPHDYGEMRKLRIELPELCLSYLPDTIENPPRKNVFPRGL
jgi:hypothetical protein